MENSQKNAKMSSEFLGKGQNLKLDKFADSTGKADKEKLMSYAVSLPNLHFNNIAQFKAMFSDKQGKFGYIQTPYKPVKVNMPYAYSHFYKNTSGANRGYFKTAFFDTFTDPLFIAKNAKDGKESVYFYKPFYFEKEFVKNGKKQKEKVFLGLFGIGVDKNGKVDFATFYKDISGSRFKEMLNLSDENIVYVKE